MLKKSASAIARDDCGNHISCCAGALVFDDVGVIDNIPQKEYNKKGVWCMFEVDFYRLPNGG